MRRCARETIHGVEDLNKPPTTYGAPENREQTLKEFEDKIDEAEDLLKMARD